MIWTTLSGTVEIDVKLLVCGGMCCQTEKSAVLRISSGWESFFHPQKKILNFPTSFLMQTRRLPYFNGLNSSLAQLPDELYELQSGTGIVAHAGFKGKIHLVLMVLR